MNPNLPLASARARATVLWLARTEQERKFLTVGAAVLGALFFYLTLLAPAVDGRARLKRDLPELRQQSAQLRSMAAEAGELARQAPQQVAPITREAMAASLATRGMVPQSLSVTGDYAKVQLDGVAFANLVAWLDAQRRDSRVGVEEAQVSAQSPAGQVNATLTLRQNLGAAQ